MNIYEHNKTKGLYKILLLSNKENRNPTKVVYIDEKGILWSKDSERFFEGMVPSSKLFKDCNPVTNEEFPQIGSFYYDNEDKNLACSVLYVTNINASKEDYPITVFYISDGKIDYLALDDFNKKFKK